MRITGKKKRKHFKGFLTYEKKSYFGPDAKKTLFLCINNLTEALSLKRIPRIVDLANTGFRLQLY